MKNVFVLFLGFILFSFVCSAASADQHKRRGHEDRRSKIEKNHDDDDDHHHHDSKHKDAVDEKNDSQSSQLKQNHDDDSKHNGDVDEKNDSKQKEVSFFSKVYHWLLGLLP